MRSCLQRLADVPARALLPRLAAALVVACGMGLAGCDRAPTEAPAARPADAPSAPSATVTTVPAAPVPPHASAGERAHAIAEAAAALAQGQQHAVSSVTSMLQHDAPAVVRALALTPASGNGEALAHWARALWANGHVDPLASVFAQLALGPALDQDAVEVFNAAGTAADGTAANANAAAMGYAVGALEAGLLASTARETQRQDQITRLLRSAARQAGVDAPGASIPAPDAPAGTRWVCYNLYPALADRRDAADRLFWAAQPVTRVGVLPNGELDLQAAAGSAAKGAFLSHWKRTRRALGG